MNEKKRKAGRPVNKAGKREFLVRSLLTKEENDILEAYCEKNRITKSQFIQEAIQNIKDVDLD